MSDHNLLAGDATERIIRIPKALQDAAPAERIARVLRAGDCPQDHQDIIQAALKQAVYDAYYEGHCLGLDTGYQQGYQALSRRLDELIKQNPAASGVATGRG